MTTATPYDRRLLSAHHTDLPTMASKVGSERLRILVVGSGGREHAIAWRLAASTRVDVVHVAPGNGGTESAGDKIVNVKIPVDDFTELVAHAKKHGLNLVVVGPEAPVGSRHQGVLQCRWN